MVLLPLCAYLHLLLELGAPKRPPSRYSPLHQPMCQEHSVNASPAPPHPPSSPRHSRDITHRILRRLPVSLLLCQQGAHLRQLRPHVLLLSDELRDRRLLRCGLILDHLLLRLESRVEGGLLLRQSHIQGVMHALSSDVNRSLSRSTSLECASVSSFASSFKLLTSSNSVDFAESCNECSCSHFATADLASERAS